MAKEAANSISAGSGYQKPVKKSQTTVQSDFFWQQD